MKMLWNVPLITLIVALAIASYFIYLDWQIDKLHKRKGEKSNARPYIH